MKYGFIKANSERYSVQRLCTVLEVNRSGYYAWRHRPKSNRALRDERQLPIVKQLWMESGCVYGYRKLHDDLMELDEPCGINRVHRLMRLGNIKAQVGYKRRKAHHGGQPAQAAANILARQFDPVEPNTAWATDITYIDTYEGWLYLAVVVDLYSRQVVGWASASRMTSDLVMQALTAAIWRRKPPKGLLIHSDQGSQFTGAQWQRYLTSHDMICSMSRRGNCHDNAVVESFFQLPRKNVFGENAIQHAMRQGAISLITSKCSTTHVADTVPTMDCRR